MDNTTLIIYINDINYHLDLAFTLFSSVILTKIWRFDISNYSTPSKIGLSTRATIRGVRYIRTFGLTGSEVCQTEPQLIRPKSYLTITLVAIAENQIHSRIEVGQFV